MNWYRQVLKPRVQHLVFHAYGTYAQAGREPYQYIYVLALARSGSTLLTHLLTSHPDIVGIGESKLPLNSPADLRAVLGKVIYIQNRRPSRPTAKYVLDKVVHDEYLDERGLDVLGEQNTRVIFLLREPVATLASIRRVVNVSGREALDYYVTRTTTLAAQAEHLSRVRPCAFVSYCQLLERTSAALRLVEAYLSLSEPLSETYERLPTTGQIAYGDNSRHIQRGKIVRDRNTELPELSEVTLATATQAYRASRQILERCCLHVDPA